MTMRNVYLEGELAERFGEKLVLKADSLQDVFKLFDANDPTFKKYLIKCAEEDIAFACEIEGESAINDLREALLPMREGDLYITPMPVGSKSGVQKILAAIALVLLFKFAPQLMGEVLFGEVTVGHVVGSLATSLALQGIQQLMAPDPATDKMGPKAYLFDGDATNFQEGDPIPLLYGELRVAGRPISFEVMNEYATHTNSPYGLLFQDHNYMGQVPMTTPDGSIQPMPTTTPEISGD